MIIILLGPPGSGKGTQGEILALKLNLPHLSTGEMFRRIVRSNDKEGKLLNEYMSQGKLVPTELVNNIVKKFLLLPEYEKGCVLDGYPRNVEQAKFLQDITKAEIKVIYFNINEEKLIKRILGRFICVKCKKNYNSFFYKPKVESICDECGSIEFIYRKDDKEEIIEERIKIYKNETLPLVEYYEKQDCFFSLDANNNKDEVSLDLINLLKKV